jgi:hypothetical protein
MRDNTRGVYYPAERGAADLISFARQPQFDFAFEIAGINFGAVAVAASRRAGQYFLPDFCRDLPQEVANPLSADLFRQFDGDRGCKQPLDGGQRSKGVIGHVISIDTGGCLALILTQPL